MRPASCGGEAQFHHAADGQRQRPGSTRSASSRPTSCSRTCKRDIARRAADRRRLAASRPAGGRHRGRPALGERALLRHRARGAGRRAGRASRRSGTSSSPPTARAAGCSPASSRCTERRHARRQGHPRVAFFFGAESPARGGAGGARAPRALRRADRRAARAAAARATLHHPAGGEGGGGRRRAGARGDAQARASRRRWRRGRTI